MLKADKYWVLDLPMLISFLYFIVKFSVKEITRFISKSGKGILYLLKDKGNIAVLNNK